MTTYDPSDTIAAIATPLGGAARGIVRVSGPQTIGVLSRLFTGGPLDEVKAASVVRGEIFAGDSLGRLPCDLHLWPSERSYTRQIAAEAHVFGSPPLLLAVLRQMCAAGARLAAPGEFTMRAFLAGRLDLTQAEAVLGVIEAQQPGELDAALAQLAGGLAGPLRRLRTNLLDLLADLEAGLDFVDEDIEFVSHDALAKRLAEASLEVAALTDQLRLRQDGAAEPRVVIVGEPNVGKSRLFNALAMGDHAIVSPVAGTTRDYLERRVDCHGLICRLCDTAGVEQDAHDGPRRLAQAMTKSQQTSAQALIVCFDATRRLSEREKEWLAGDRALAAPPIFVWTKRDAAPSDWRPEVDLSGSVVTSAERGEGLEELRVRLAQVLRCESARPGAVAGTAIRCRESLARAQEALARALECARGECSDELTAVEIRLALSELGHVAGAVYTDDLLDRIFSRFCIGK